MKMDQVTKQIIGCAFRVHNGLGSGFLEKVYENALCIELREAGFKVLQQHPVPVYYRNIMVGDYFADLLVDDQIVVEIKAVENLAPIHEVQVVNYLAGTNLDTGLLINFGQSVEVKRKFRTYKPKDPAA